MKQFYTDQALLLLKHQYKQETLNAVLLEIKHLLLQKNSLSVVKKNKQIVLVAQRQKLDKICKLIWNGVNVSSPSEQAFINEYKQLVRDLKGLYLDIDLNQGDEPPKNIFVEVRVVKECGKFVFDQGEIMTEMGVLPLRLGTQYYLKKAEVQDLIMSGHLVVV
ncbi:DNA replication protein psf1 [Boothiomyces macroporosus]|uniref:DNA replication complex GINS protein PSF1 n=1 Tax=Boothiomyces macroporosus TaxID=261099 RepID=A0AAD5Y4B9_9FUNG|nr:DNA replication protein psf1 [Boothiomyces macroporosus]